MNIIEINDFSFDAFKTAIDQISNLIETDFPNLLSDGFNGEKSELIFNFKINEIILDEISFFKIIELNEIDVSEEIEKLIISFYKRDDIDNCLVRPWRNIGMPPLGPALKALLILDIEKVNIFRLFIQRHDSEYEKYCEHILIPDLIAKHSWEKESLIRTAAYYCADHMGNTGVSSFWAIGGFWLPSNNMIEGAKKFYSADNLAKIISEEYIHFHKTPVPEWYDYMEGCDHKLLMSLNDLATRVETNKFDYDFVTNLVKLHPGLKEALKSRLNNNIPLIDQVILSQN